MGLLIFHSFFIRRDVTLRAFFQAIQVQADHMPAYYSPPICKMDKYRLDIGLNRN